MRSILRRIFPTRKIVKMLQVNKENTQNYVAKYYTMCCFSYWTFSFFVSSVYHSSFEPSTCRVSKEESTLSSILLPKIYLDMLNNLSPRSQTKM